MQASAALRHLAGPFGTAEAPRSHRIPPPLPQYPRLAALLTTPRSHKHGRFHVPASLYLNPLPLPLLRA